MQTPTRGDILTQRATLYSTLAALAPQREDVQAGYRRMIRADRDADTTARVYGTVCPVADHQAREAAREYDETRDAYERTRAEELARAGYSAAVAFRPLVSEMEARRRQDREDGHTVARLIASPPAGWTGAAMRQRRPELAGLSRADMWGRICVAGRVSIHAAGLPYGVERGRLEAIAARLNRRSERMRRGN